MINNIKVLKFDNSTESNLLIKINSVYYMEVVFYDDNEKSLIAYNSDSGKITEIITVDFKFSFFADEYSKKIYCHYIYNDILSIYEIVQSQLVKIIEKSINENWNCIDIVGLGKCLFIKEYIERDDLCQDIKCYMYLFEEEKYYEINDYSIINSVYLPTNIVNLEDREYLVLEESYVESYEIIEIRNNNPEEILLSTNKIIIYDLKEFIKSIKNEKEIKKKAILSSEGENFISLLGIRNNKIMVYKKGNKSEILYLDENTVEDSIQINNSKNNGEVTNLINKENIYFLYSIETKQRLIDELGSILTEFKNDNNEKYVIDVIEDKYIIFDVNRYDENDIQHIERHVYDFEEERWHEYEGNFIVINDKLI